MEYFRWGTTDISVGDCKDPAVLKRFLTSIGLGSYPFVSCEQIHGNSVWIKEGHISETVPGTDGLITRTPGVVLGVFSADCVPVFMMDSRTRIAALLHAGWRGVEGQIVSCAIHRMKKNFSSEPKEIRVVLGPHIRDCCFEVGKDVAGRFVSDAQKLSGGKLTLNLSAALRGQLLQCGVSPNKIEDAGACTFCDANYFSYRREKTNKRMLSYMVIHEENN